MHQEVSGELCKLKQGYANVVTLGNEMGIEATDCNKQDESLKPARNRRGLWRSIRRPFCPKRENEIEIMSIASATLHLGPSCRTLPAKVS